MKPTTSLVLLSGLLLALAGAADKPNIIVADEMGYADIGVQGGKDIPTPNIGIGAE